MHVCQPCSHVQLFATPWTVASILLCPQDFLQERMLEKVAISFLQGIFPTQGLNLGLPHCGQILNCLSYQGHFKCIYLEPLFQSKLRKQVLRLLPEDIRAGLRFMCTSTHKHIHMFYAYLLCISRVYFRYIDVYYVYLLFKCVFMSSANSDGFTSFPMWMNEFCHLQQHGWIQRVLCLVK